MRDLFAYFVITIPSFLHFYFQLISTIVSLNKSCYMKNYLRTLISLVLLSTLSNLQGQIKLSLVVNEYAERVEVYALHENPDFSSAKTYLATGQVTILTETGSELTNINNINGMWMLNSSANAPKENPTKDYFSFGFPEYMEVPLSGSAPTLLFTAEFSGSSQIKLITNDDPFAQIPNSLNLNPGNEMTMIDLANGKEIITYTDNYQPCGVSPYPCELNSHYAKEDVNNTRTNNAVSNMTYDQYLMAIENEAKGTTRQ